MTGGRFGAEGWFMLGGGGRVVGPDIGGEEGMGERGRRLEIETDVGWKVSLPVEGSLKNE